MLRPLAGVNGNRFEVNGVLFQQETQRVHDVETQRRRYVLLTERMVDMSRLMPVVSLQYVIDHDGDVQVRGADARQRLIFVAFRRAECVRHRTG